MPTTVNPGLRLVRALDDPLRYEMLMRLFAGAATVSELVATTGAAQSKVSNHLAILREADVVRGERLGRSVVYAIADPNIAAVVEALENACGGLPGATRATPELAVARSCYDHLAGRLGVALFDALVRTRALRGVRGPAPARKLRGAYGPVDLGPAARPVFGALGIDVDAVLSQHRQFATACSDWTETRAHLGGALGAALQERLVRERWVLRRGGTRVVRITDRGRDGLREQFGIDVDALRR
jgi:DNA-binding transcriptional ArsR family regulator